MELAILLNLMIHYSSNGGPAPLGQRRYCIGSRGNHEEITVPADFIVSLIYINQGGKELYRLKIYISEAVL